MEWVACCRAGAARATLAGMRVARSLLEAFALDRRCVVALAGGGGKTSLIWLLARALAEQGWRVLTTTTTRIFPPAPEESPALVLLEHEPDAVAAIRRALATYAHVTAALRRNPDGKLAGLAPRTVDELAAAGVADAIVVEADGAAGRPLKAAREGEPVFPQSTTDCLIVVGADALGAPLDEQWVYRSALAAEITGLERGATVDVASAALLLVGPRGLARPAPRRSRVVVFVNKVESAMDQSRSQDLARALFAQAGARLAAVVAGSLRSVADRFVVFEK